MGQVRRTFFLLILALFLAAVVWLVGHGPKKTGPKQLPFLFGPSILQSRLFSVSYLGTTQVYQIHSGVWQDHNGKSRNGAVHRYLLFLSHLRPEQVVGEGTATEKALHLNQPQFTLSSTLADGKRLMLLIGQATPGMTGYYGADQNKRIYLFGIGDVDTLTSFVLTAP